MGKRHNTRTKRHNPKAKAAKSDGAVADLGEVLDAEFPLEEPPIFKLIDDCCYQIFKWLSLNDLYSFGQTCKWAQQVAGNFFQTNHRAIEVEVNADDFTARGVTLDGFSEFFQNVRISFHTKMAAFQNFRTNCGQSIKQLRLCKLRLSSAKIKCLENVLETVECLKIEGCTMGGDVYTNLLMYCTQLKRLCIRDDSYIHIYHRGKFETMIETENAWLLRKYATIEHLELCPQTTYEINAMELETFFKQNPNVQSFAIDIEFLSKNANFFKTTNMKIAKLAIRYDFQGHFLHQDVGYACKLLSELHDRGVYQSLDLYAPHGLPKKIDSLLALEKSLERVYFNCVRFDDILLCLRHATKVKEITVTRSAVNSAIDLAAWNNERKNLIGARKVTIYVDDRTFLATKVITHQTNFELIELKQNRSSKWDRDFDYLKC